MRVKHVTYRLSHIRSLCPLPAEVPVSAIEEHIARLAEIERKVISMPGCDYVLNVQQDSIPGAAATTLTAEGTDIGRHEDFLANLTSGPMLNAGLHHTVSTGVLYSRTLILLHLSDPNSLHTTQP
jgi:hypothetical protein